MCVCFHKKVNAMMIIVQKMIYQDWDWIYRRPGYQVNIKDLTKHLRHSFMSSFVLIVEISPWSLYRLQTNSYMIYIYIYRTWANLVHHRNVRRMVYPDIYMWMLGRRCDYIVPSRHNICDGGTLGRARALPRDCTKSQTPWRRESHCRSVVEWLALRTR